MADYQGRFVTAGDPDLLRAIRAAGREQRFSHGEEIQAAGTLHPGGPILIIERGFASTVASSASGQYTLLSIHGPGDLIGEHALFGGPSEAHGLAVTGMSKGRAWRVRRDHFRRILQSRPQRWETLACHLHDRAEAAEERICLMAGETASRRLAVFLLQLLSYDKAARARDDRAQLIPLPLSQAELAEWIGVSRETAERVLSGWARRGLVRTGRRYLLIQDVPQLEKIANVRRGATAQAA